jgi:hypothetical protein
MPATAQARDFLLTCDQPSHANGLKTQWNSHTPIPRRAYATGLRRTSLMLRPFATPPILPTSPRRRRARDDFRVRHSLENSSRVHENIFAAAHLQPVVPSIPSATIPCDGHPNDLQTERRQHPANTVPTPSQHRANTVPTPAQHCLHTLPTLPPHAVRRAPETISAPTSPFSIPHSPLPAKPPATTH